MINEILGQIMSWVGTIMLVIGGGFLVLAIWYLGKLAYFKAESIRIEWVRKMVQGALAEGAEAISRIVKDLQNEFVDEWKRASADGKLTDEEKEKLKRLVMERLAKTVPAAIIEVLRNNLPDFEAWVESQVNAHVWELKAKAEGAKAITVPLQAAPSASAS